MEQELIALLATLVFLAVIGLAGIYALNRN